MKLRLLSLLLVKCFTHYKVKAWGLALETQTLTCCHTHTFTHKHTQYKSTTQSKNCTPAARRSHQTEEGTSHMLNLFSVSEAAFTLRPITHSTVLTPPDGPLRCSSSDGHKMLLPRSDFYLVCSIICTFTDNMSPAILGCAALCLFRCRFT